MLCDDQNGRRKRDGSEFLLGDVYMIVLGFGPFVMAAVVVAGSKQ